MPSSLLDILFDSTKVYQLYPDGVYVDSVKQKGWSTKGNNVVSSDGILVPELNSIGGGNYVALSGATDTVSGTSSSVQTNIALESSLVLALASGVVIDFSGTLDFKGGNDYLYGTGNALGVFTNDSGVVISGAAGIINGGTTLMGSGKDQVSGYGNATAVAFEYENFINAAVGVGVLNIGSLNTGSDADTIQGTGVATISTAYGFSLANAAIASGVFNIGRIDMGSGNNRLVGSATSTITTAQSFTLLNGALAAGVFNGLGLLQQDPVKSVITSSGSGDKSQEINGTANAVMTSIVFEGDNISPGDVDENALINGALAVGVWNGVGNSMILTNGSAKITGTATAQADAVNTGAYFVDATVAAGIFNAGYLSTGSSADVITGQASTKVATLGNEFDLTAGILNIGLISTASGSDVLDAMTGGFKGYGVAALGSGNDTVKGYGAGYFDGGSNTDLLTLNKGSYMITTTATKEYTGPFVEGEGENYFVIADTDLCTGDMYVRNFENITTIDGVKSFAAVAADGTFTV